MVEENKDLFNFNEEDKVQGSMFHNFKEKGKEIVKGILTEIEENKNGEVYHLEYNEEEIIVGSYAALRGKLLKEDIGKAVQIHFTGEKKGNTGRLYMEFDVYKKDIKKS